MLGPSAGEKILEEAVGLADDAGDPISSVFGRLTLIVGALHRDDHPLVARHVEEGREVLEGAGGQMRSFYHALAGWSEVRVGRFEEARRHGQSALALASEVGDPVLVGALAALMLALLEVAQGRIEEAAAVVEPILREPRAAGPTREDAMLTGVWARVLVARGRLDEAEAVTAEAVRLAGQIGDGLQYAFCQSWAAGLARLRGDGALARAAAETLLSHARQQENPAFEAVALRELSLHARLDGDLDDADGLAHRALALSVEAGLWPDVADHLAAVAGVAAAGESGEEGARLFAAASALRQRLGSVPAPWDQMIHDADVDLVRGALDPEVFEVTWAEGQALGIEEAVAYARRGRGERKRPSTGWASLTPVERQVVDLVAQGLRNPEIAPGASSLLLPPSRPTSPTSSPSSASPPGRSLPPSPPGGGSQPIPAHPVKSRINGSKPPAAAPR